MDDIILYMAPILGVTDGILRSAFMRVFGGFDLAVTPFIKTTRGGECKEGKLADLFPHHNRWLPIHPQILTNDPDDFLQMAAVLHDLGYETINLNLGCPMPTSTTKIKGAGLLAHPDRVDRLLDQILNRLHGGLSIKTRIGFQDSRELERLLVIFNRYPLREIIIHPRTARQRYAGEIDHVSFAKCLAELTHELVYNGDIQTTAGFLHLQRSYPTVKKWMIGRGALRDPWLPAAIKMRSFGSEKKNTMIHSFHEELVANYRERLHHDRAVIERMMTLWDYLADGLALPERLLKRMHKAKNLQQYQMFVDEALAQQHAAQELYSPPR